MNEKMNKYMKPVSEFWSNKSSKQKMIYITGTLSVIVIVAIATYLLTRVSFVPLYTNLTPAETGQIKAELDTQGIKSEISPNGTTISVPDNMVDTLLVDLAAKGIPDSGNVDYSYFSQNSSFSATDNEFNMIKLASMQTELAKLIKSIEGIEDAKVMITLPKESLWVNEDPEQASASIVLKTKPGYKFNQNQVNALYHLVSKSVPNLPTDNIVITNQNFEYFDMKKEENSSSESLFLSQQQIKKDIERDIQRRVQQMLSTVMGENKVVTTVTADVDFTQENREENLVEPVDEEKMQGIAVSAEKIKETYTGNGQGEGGVPGTGETDIPSYQAGTEQNGDYNRTEDRINYEVNKIKKTITESPYKVRDIGIGVMVEPPNPEQADSLPQQTIDDIRQMLGTIVQTSISKGENETPLTEEELNSKVFVSIQKFNGKADESLNSAQRIPIWVYIIAGILVFVILLLVFLLVRRNRKGNEVIVEEIEMDSPILVEEDLFNAEDQSEAAQKRRQLEKIAKDRPEEFAKLLRTWLSEE